MSLETLDMSDNDLRDSQGRVILKFVKLMSERNDHQMWKQSLRNTTVEDELRARVNALNGRETDEDKQKQIDSNMEVKRILQNITNSDFQTPESILEQQVHVVNYNNQRLTHF